MLAQQAVLPTAHELWGGHDATAQLQLVATNCSWHAPPFASLHATLAAADLHVLEYLSSSAVLVLGGTEARLSHPCVAWTRVLPPSTKLSPELSELLLAVENEPQHLQRCVRQQLGMLSDAKHDSKCPAVSAHASGPHATLRVHFVEPPERRTCCTAAQRRSRRLHADEAQACETRCKTQQREEFAQAAANDWAAHLRDLLGDVQVCAAAWRPSCPSSSRQM